MSTHFVVPFSTLTYINIKKFTKLQNIKAIFKIQKTVNTK